MVKKMFLLFPMHLAFCELIEYSVNQKNKFFIQETI